MSAIFTDLKATAVGGCSIRPATITSDTTTTGQAVDMQLADDVLHAVLLTGDNGDSSTVVTVTLTECATSGGSYTAVSGGAFDVYTGATLGDDLCVFLGTRKRTLRYVKAVCVTSGGGTPSVKIGVGVFGRRKISGAGYTGYSNAPTI